MSTANTKPVSVTDILTELDAGVFEQKISNALAEVAMGVVGTGKVGKVVVTFDLKQIDASSQVSVKHQVKFIKPMPHGKISEENTTATPMHVGVRGRLSLFPENQEKMVFESVRDRA